VERASQVFGLSEGVIARAAAPGDGGWRSRSPSRSRPRCAAQRRGESELERRLLRGLWQAPELLDAARAELQPEDLEDAGARALAGWWWEHGVALPEGDGEAAALARELASTQREQDPSAEVLGTIRRLVVRRLQR
jgi:hypothetical protein